MIASCTLHIAVLQVDKDVAVAKEHFGLPAPYTAMSPLVLYDGYTKKFLDGKVQYSSQTISTHDVEGGQFSYGISGALCLPTY